MTTADGEAGGHAGTESQPGARDLPLAFANLERVVLDACTAEAEWPAQIAAGVYAGVDFAIANPDVIEGLAFNPTTEAESKALYEHVIERLAELVQSRAPRESRRPGSTDEALVAGIVGLVGDHIRVGRLERLAELRPELVLLALLPYLGFAEAQRWANRVDREWAPES